MINLRSPKVFYNYLDKFVVGQESAKKALSVALFAHITKVLAHKGTGQQFRKQINLFYGPTGCGKTHLIKTACKAAGLPYYGVSAKDITATGWKGTNIDEMIDSYVTANKDHKLIEYGVLHLDEFDKICNGDSFQTDQQHTWLNFIEGFKYVVRSDRNKKPYNFDSSNILVLITGSFGHLQEKRQNKSYNIGFATDEEEGVKTEIDQKDLVDAGVVRELAGRINVTTEIEALDRDAMRGILLNEYGIYGEYRKLFGDRIGLTLDDEVIDEIIDEALAYKTGARGLQTAIEKRVQDPLFNIGLDGEVDWPDFHKDLEID